MDESRQDRDARIIERQWQLLEKTDGYHEGGTAWQKWILGVLGVLTAGGIVGGVEMYGQLQAIRQQQIDAVYASEERRRELDRRLEGIEVKLGQRNGP